MFNGIFFCFLAWVDYEKMGPWVTCKKAPCHLQRNKTLNLKESFPLVCCFLLIILHLFVVVAPVRSNSTAILSLRTFWSPLSAVCMSFLSFYLHSFFGLIRSSVIFLCSCSDFMCSLFLCFTSCRCFASLCNHQLSFCCCFVLFLFFLLFFAFCVFSFTCCKPL